MFETAALLAFIVAATIITVVPGPDQMLILARSIGGGRRVGVATSLGMSVGVLIHTLAAAVGLSALLMSSALAFTVLKYLGAAYLIYLGVQAFRQKSPHVASSPSPTNSVNVYQAFRQAVITDVLNPKVALFFLAFLPQFVHPERGSVFVQFIVLGLVFALIGVVWDTLLALMAGSLSEWLGRNPVFLRWQQRVMGVVLIGLGVRLAFSRRD